MRESKNILEYGQKYVLKKFMRGIYVQDPISVFNGEM